MGSSAMPSTRATTVPLQRRGAQRIPCGNPLQTRWDNRSMRVLVTGGAGYIGSVVTEVLMARGHAVSVYDDLSEGHRDAVPDGARLIEGDLLDRARLDDALRETRAEAVAHMAAVCQVGESMIDPAKY